ncbi:MAG: hypothetical protein LCH96_13680 [Actinobacteria bacterium]|nr:hypothetical protein [Actinomycetota bacterium]
MEHSAPVQPDAAFGHKVRVHCPTCGSRATVAPFGSEVRLTSPACGRTDVLGTWPEHWPLSFAAARRVVQEAGLELWFVAECCGGHQLWALDEDHVAYELAFVASRNRSADFPSVSGNRQLADKFPAWMVTAKHRDEVARALTRLANTP